MKAFIVFLFFFIIMCGKNSPTGPVIELDAIRYGDTVSAGIRYQKIDLDTLPATNVIEITLILKNITGRELTLDSTWNGTYIHVNHASDNNQVFSSPSVAIWDTLLHKAILVKAFDSLFYKARWDRLHLVTRAPLPTGQYNIMGSFLGFSTGRLTYDQM